MLYHIKDELPAAMSDDDGSQPDITWLITRVRNCAGLRRANSDHQLLES